MNDNFYEVIPVYESKTIKEALPDVDFENAKIAVNGNLTDENHILHDDDICAIRLFPKATAVLITAGVIAGLVITNEIVRAVTGKSLIQHLGDALRRWLLPDDTNANQETTQSIPQLRGAKNQSNRNKPIPLILGRHFYTPMYLGTPYTEIGGVDGEDQYYNALYLLGWGDLKVSDVRLGAVSGISRNTEGTLNGMLPYNDDPKFGDPSFRESNPLLELRHTGEVGLYPQRVVEERLSIELMNVEGESRLEPTRFSAKNPQRVQVEITFNNGLISYDESGSAFIAVVGIRLEWRGDPAQDVWHEFGQFGIGQSSISYSPETRTSIITRSKPKQMRFVAERYFSFSEVNAAVNRTVELRIIRTNPKDPSDTRTISTVFLSAIRTWCFDYDLTVANNNVMVIQRPMIEKYRDKTARLGFRIKATDNLQGTIDALNCMVESYGRTWNGSSWSSAETPTNNPASAALKILQSPALGNNAYIGKAEEMIDLNSFGEFYKWCADREYTCNGVLVNEKRVDDLLNAVLSTGRGMRILNETRYAVLIDRERINPVTVLNSQNVLEATNQKSFEDLPDGFSVKFINEIDGYQETEIFVMKDGSNKPKPESRIESIEMPFVTDYKQVVRNAWYMLACRHLRPEVWIRKVSVDGYLIGIGSLVEIQDDTILVGIGEGAAITGLTVENNIITEIKTDGLFEVYDLNKMYGIKIMQYDGISTGKIRTVQVPIPNQGIHRNFKVSIPLSDRPIPSTGDIIAFGEYGKITTNAICFGKKPNGDGTFDLTLIPYQEGIYTTDSGQIPEYQHNITPPQGIPPLNQIPPPPVTMPDLIGTITGMNIEGRDAVIYELVPSVNVILKFSNGKIDPEIISCAQEMTAGNALPVPSNKMLQYVTSNSGGMAVLYTAPVQVGEWDWIEFVLSDRGIELDRQRVPVLREGSDAVNIILANEGYQIRCYSDGTPHENQIPFSIQAWFYRGIDLINADWELYNAPRGITINSKGLIQVNSEYKYNPNDIIRYPGDIADPMPDPFYPWDGTWQIGQLELGFVTEVIVWAHYEDRKFQKTLRILKVLDGEKGDKGDKGDQGDASPQYLGRTYSPGTSTGVVTIYDNPSSQRQVQANNGDFVLFLGKTIPGTIYEEGICIRWHNGLWHDGYRYGWYQIPVEADGNFESNPYMQSMADNLNSAPRGRFLSIIVQDLIAKTAMIEKLFTRYVEMSGDGEIISKGFQGINGTVPGFRLKASTGLVEANKIKTRGMDAVDATVKGNLLVGDAWHNNGQVNNPAARGSFLALNMNLTGDQHEIRIKSLGLYGRSFFGFTHGNTPGETIFDGTKLIYPTCVTQLVARSIRGTHSILSLYNHINAMLFRANNYENYPCPINGTLRFSLPPPVNMGSWMHVVYITVLNESNRPYKITGTNNEGYPLDITITSSSVRVDYLGNTSTGTTGTFEANFVCL